MALHFPLLVTSSCHLLLLLLLFSGVKGQEERLEAVRCRSEFPTGMGYMSSIYTGEGKIYLFGGYNGSWSRSIYLFNVWGDSLEEVGTLPTSNDGNALAEDSQGNILHFGNGRAGDTILRFNPSSGVTEVVGRLPQEMVTIGAVQTRADRSALVFGRNDVLEVDLVTYNVTPAGLPLPLTAGGVAWDGGDRVLLFATGGSTVHQLYSISEGTVTNFTSPEPHVFNLWHSTISSPKSAWVVGNYGVNKGNGIFEVDFQTLEFKFWPVDNYPAPANGHFVYAATTYIAELHRLYMFGGYNGSSSSFLDDIMFIDLPGERPVTSTTTTTPTPPTFDCSRRPDGFYASPTACDGYFGCLGGETFEFTCPPPHHFNPVLKVCDLPELVHCDLGCSGKEDGVYPHPYYCEFYLRCSEGQAHVLECPPPLLFDREVSQCNFPHLVNCTNKQL